MTEEEKLQRDIDARCHWHKWFAWYPVKFVVNGITYRAWLEYVGRKDILYTAMGDMYREFDSVGLPLFCPAEDVIIKALQEPEIIDKRNK